MHTTSSGMSEQQTAKRIGFPLDLYKLEIYKVHFNPVWEGGGRGGNRSKDEGV